MTTNQCKESDAIKIDAVKKRFKGRILYIVFGCLSNFIKTSITAVYTLDSLHEMIVWKQICKHGDLDSEADPGKDFLANAYN